MNPDLRQVLALQIFIALLTNQRTPYDNPKVVERLMRESYGFADRWMEVSAEEKREGGALP